MTNHFSIKDRQEVQRIVYKNQTYEMQNFDFLKNKKSSNPALMYFKSWHLEKVIKGIPKAYLRETYPKFIHF